MQSVDRYFQVADLRLRYRDEGAGAAVVWLHGWTLDLEVWEPQCQALRGSMRVVRLDRRGFGLSEGRPDLAADVADLQALLDHLQIARAALVGMSQGARVALAMALQHPERVASLVLDGPPNAGESAESAEEISFVEYRALVREGGLAAFKDAWRRHRLMELQTADPAVRALVDRMLDRYRGLDLLEPAAPAPAFEPMALARLCLPTLVVNGELDSVQRLRAGERLAREIPGAERGLLPDAGHLANLDIPRAYNDLVRAFILRPSCVAA